jgi:hypothetical protein
MTMPSAESRSLASGNRAKTLGPASRAPSTRRPDGPRRGRWNCRHALADLKAQARQVPAEKDQAVLLRADDDGRLLGLSTVKLYRGAARGPPRRVLCSGDTVVAPEAWCSPAAVRTAVS